MASRKKQTSSTTEDLAIFTLRLDKGLLQEVHEMAEKMDLNTSQWLRRAVIAYLKLCTKAITSKQAMGNTQAYSLDQESSAMLDILIQKGLV